MSKFQIILVSIFGAFVLIGVLLFSLSRGSGNSNANLVIWGDISNYDFQTFLSDIGVNNDQSVKITYVEKKKANFQNDFVEALASDKGPDIVLLPQDLILKNKNKLFVTPYTSLSQADFKNTFVQEGELFLFPDGIYGFPFIIDPMVAYWNRDIFNNFAVSKPPEFWDEFYALSEKMTQKDQAQNISQSTVALGEYANVNNAKDILSLLMLQAGTPIVYDSGNGLVSALGQRFNLPIVPAEAALDFYTQFSNPVKPFYSWNRSEPNSQEAFLSGKLAIYFGFASEYKNISLKNPNLNMDVTSVPQSRVGNKKITIANIEGLAITNQSQNKAAAYKFILNLVSSDSIKKLSTITGLPPVRRDLLTTIPETSAQVVFYNGAIQAKGWLDPDSKATDSIFKDMIESITSGREQSNQAVNKADTSINALLKN